MLLPLALEYFEAVVEAGSVQAAARNLLVAPSALSRQIGKLEHELGVTLFTRQPSGMSVTQAGAQLHEYAARSRAEIKLLKQQFDTGNDGLRGSVTIAGVEGMMPSLLPRWVALARREYPGIQFTIQQLGSVEVISAVLNGDADFGFTFGYSTRAGLRRSGDIHSPIRLFVTDAHPMYGRERCAISELAECRFILPDQAFGLRNEVELAFAEAGTPLQVRAEASSLRFCLAVALHSDLVTFSTPRMADDFRDANRLWSIKVDSPRFKLSQISLVTRSTDRHPLTNELERFFSRQMKHL